MKISCADTEQTKIGRGRFYVLMAMLLLFCLAEYVFQINIPQAIFLAVAFLIALTGDADEIIAMCMCCIPLHNFFEFSFAVLMGIGGYVLKFSNRIRLNCSIFPVVLMVLWELLHCFLPELNAMQFGSLVVPWILLAILMCSPAGEFDYSFIVRAFSVTTVAICCILLGKIVYSSSFNLSAAFANLYRLGMETAEMAVSKVGAQMISKVNANTLGLLCVFGITGLMQLRVIGQNKTSDIACIIAQLMFGIMTRSKTFFFCLVFAMLLLFFSIEGSVRRKIKYIFGGIAVVAIVLTLSYLIMPRVIENFISRFYENDFTSGRMSHMGIYNKFILSNLNVLFYGIGLQNFGDRVLQLCQEAIYVPHNGIQELIIAWGIPGVGIVAALWICMIIQSRKKRSRQGLVNYIVLLVFLLKIQAGQMLTSAYTMLTFSLAYLSMCANSRTREENEKPLTSVISLGGMKIGRAITLLCRRWWVIAVTAMICGATAFVVTHYFVKSTYESSIMLYVNSSYSIEQLDDSISKDDILVSRDLTETSEIILQSRSLLTAVAECAGVNVSYEKLQKMVAFELANDTEICIVTVTSEDPKEAEMLANAIADLLPARIENIIKGASVKIVEYAVAASKPTSPSKSINTMVGFVFGLVLSAWLLLWKGMLDKKIHTLNDIAELENYPLLAVIPDVYKNSK